MSCIICVCVLPYLKVPEPALGFSIGDLEASSDEDADDGLDGFIVDEQGKPVKTREREGGVRDRSVRSKVVLTLFLVLCLDSTYSFYFVSKTLC